MKNPEYEHIQGETDAKTLHNVIAEMLVVAMRLEKTLADLEEGSNISAHNAFDFAIDDLISIATFGLGVPPDNQGALEDVLGRVEAHESDEMFSWDNLYNHRPMASHEHPAPQREECEIFIGWVRKWLEDCAKDSPYLIRWRNRFA